MRERECGLTVQVDVEEVRRRLRHVQFPGYSRDIVSFGFVRDIRVDGGTVTIVFAPNTQLAEKIDQMESDIRETLSDMSGVTGVSIQRRRLDDVMHTSMTPLQAELLAEGTVPEIDPLGNDPHLRKIDLAPGAGYGETGPAPFDGPGGNDRSAKTEPRQPGTGYGGDVPVFQWDIDPTNANAEGGETQVSLDDWDFNMWWQVHPSRLVYASIQAVREDLAENQSRARPHPVGRSVAVNIVYDLERGGVVAIYGTARDFRPFVRAFLIGFGLPVEGDEPGKPRRKQQEDGNV